MPQTAYVGKADRNSFFNRRFVLRINSQDFERSMVIKMIIFRTIQHLSYFSTNFLVFEHNFKAMIHQRLGIYVIIPQNEVEEIIYKNKSYLDVNKFLEVYEHDKLYCS